MIDLYTWPAPNGHKVHMLVEELGIAYRLMPIDITRSDMACFPWIRIQKLTGVALDEFPRVQAWYGSRPLL